MSQRKESMVFKPFTYNGVILYNPNDYSASTYQMSEFTSCQNAPDFSFQGIRRLDEENNVRHERVKSDSPKHTHNDEGNDRIFNSNLLRRPSFRDTRVLQNGDPFIALE